MSILSRSQFKGNSIALCFPGEVYRREWVHSAMLLFVDLFQHFEAVYPPVFHYESNVYATRAELADFVLKLNPRPYYTFWLDDDNLISTPQLFQLLADLDSELADVIAAWCWRKPSDPRMPFAPFVSCGYFDDDEMAYPWHYRELMNAPSDLVSVEWTGFPAVAMRTETLARIPRPFQPVLTQTGRGFLSEDISFCRHAADSDVRVAVDRRLKIPHLKLGAGDPPGFTDFTSAEQSAESETAA